VTLRTQRSRRISALKIRRLGIAGALAFSALAVLVWAAIAIASDDSGIGGTTGGSTEPGGEPVELPAKRTATSDTFQFPDGSREARIYQAPVNYRDEDGDWQPIKEGLEREGGYLVNGDNSFDVALPSDLDSTPVRFTSGDAWVSERPLAIATEAANLEDEIATYEGARSGPSYEFSGLANGLKENISLDGPGAPSTYRFHLDASEGVRPELAKDGSIDFRDEGGELVATLPAPVMYDSATPAQISDAVQFSLAPQGSGWQLSVEADSEWLSSPARVFPAKIDPSVIVPTPNIDCGISNGPYSEYQLCGTTGWPLSGAFAKYHSSGPDEYARSLYHFDLSSIPATASINSAKVGLFAPTAAINVYGAELWGVEKPWTNAVTWKRYALGANWTSEGGDAGPLNPNSQITTSSRGSQGGWWEFSGFGLTSLVQKWLQGKVPNNGVMVKLMDEKAHECSPTCIERLLEFNSSANANKPYLSVVYQPQAPSGKIVSPADGTRSAKRFKLVASWTHSGVTGITFQYKGQEGWTNIPESRVTTKSGKAVSWPFPTNGARESEPIYWNAPEAKYPFPRIKGEIRAVFAGTPSAEGYSSPSESELNRDLGGPKDAKAPVGPGVVDLLTGNLNTSQTDVAIPGFNSSLEFSRSFNSRDAKTEEKGVLGPGWTPGVPVEATGGAAWKSIKKEKEVEEWEGEEEGEPPFQVTYEYAILTTLEGEELSFEKQGSTYVIPPELTGWSLVEEAAGSRLVLTDPGGTQTFFENLGSGNEFVPVSISQPGGAGNQTRMVYDLVSGKKRLKAAIAPSAPNVSCSAANGATYPVLAAEQVGCHVLTFSCKSMTSWGGEASLGERLASISYHAATSASAMGHWEVASYSYSSKGRLAAEWDPRISPALKEAFTYATEGQIATITPPGQEPWSFEYGNIAGENPDGRLVKVKRASLLASPSTAETTIAYEVPTSGAGAPNEMAPANVAQWGQTLAPVDATAIFPPDAGTISNPPSSYAKATVYYMDVEGQIVNTATPAGGGVSASPITTSETDAFGNVVRELSAKSRNAVLALPEAERKARWLELETKRLYSADGTQLEEEWGPTHQVRIEASGAVVQARAYRQVEYDKGWTGPGLKPHLPTSETTGALYKGEVLDPRSTQTEYDWTLRKPVKVIANPGAGEEEIKRVIAYDSATGLMTEARQPKEAASGTGAGTTKTFYYGTPGSGAVSGCESVMLAGLPCKILPAAQASGAGRPELLFKTFAAFNALGEPTEILESPNGGSGNLRKTFLTYDTAGRPLSRKIEGGGIPVGQTETLYGSTSGAPTVQRFKCETSCTGFDDQATTTTYDSLGRVKEYEDADGNIAKTTYDVDGRPATTSDGKGSQTMTYDATSGLLTKLEDSAAGTFTAAYDADGNMTERALPDGLTAKTTYDEVDQPIHLTYTKASSCGTSCTWYDEGIERSIYGRDLSQSGTLANSRYTYDKVGRLTSAAETPAGGSCTTRSYTYDLDSNRKTLTSRPPVAGACNWSTGTTQTYKYDAADRLEGPTYDAWGRITNLPGEFAGGKTLATSYFSTDMVASQTQNGVTNTFQLDAALRQRQRVQAGGLEGVEVFHYANGSDSPAWTQLGSSWSRNIAGIGGELGAIQSSSSGTTLRLTNLHGDVVASASVNSAETKLIATYRFDEFGNPIASSAGRFGWLGGKQRRTELSSGVIQMGARSYIPQLGRFLTSDPVPGGSANAYDYVDQDPVNGFDLGGECLNKRYRECHIPPKQSHAGHKTRQPRPKLIRTGAVAVTGGGITATGGYVGATFTYTARESVSVSAYLTFRGQTSGLGTASGSSGTILIPTVNYSGTVYSGEILTVCVVAVGEHQSERKCYNHVISVTNTPI
jgi:RHS repeat-associated protein